MNVERIKELKAEIFDILRQQSDLREQMGKLEQLKGNKLALLSKEEQEGKK